MKLLIFDYFRRKWWILALGAAVEAGLGWAVAQGSTAGFPGPGFVSVFQFQIALFMGAILLSVDLRRGLARVAAVLPVTARQAGRAWWLSSVGLPAAVLAVWLFFGAEIFRLFHPDKVFPGRALALISLCTLLGQGVCFTLVFTPTVFIAMRAAGGKRWCRAVSVCLRALTGLLIGGGAFFVYLNGASWMMSGVFVGAGSVLTIASWFGAGHFVRGRAGFRLAALQSGNPPGRHRPPGGYGGIPLFIGATFVRCFLVGLAMEALTPLFTAMLMHTISWQAALKASAASGNMVWMLMTFQFIPGLLHLRFLRTLPISASCLAGTLITMSLLPIVALAALAAGAAGAALGTAAALGVLKYFALTLAPCALCLWFAVRQGIGMQAFAVLMLTVVVFQTLPVWARMVFRQGEAPLSAAVAVAAAAALLGFVFTRRALTRSSQAYRVQSTLFGNTAWGAGR